MYTFCKYAHCTVFARNRVRSLCSGSAARPRLKCQVPGEKRTMHLFTRQEIQFIEKQNVEFARQLVKSIARLGSESAFERSFNFSHFTPVVILYERAYERADGAMKTNCRV